MSHIMEENVILIGTFILKKQFIWKSTFCWLSRVMEASVFGNSHYYWIFWTIYIFYNYNYFFQSITSLIFSLIYWNRNSIFAHIKCNKSVNADEVSGMRLVFWQHLYDRLRLIPLIYSHLAMGTHIQRYLIY